MAIDLGDADVLVTGGTGFIGSHLVDELTVLSDNTIVIDDNSRGDEANLESRPNLEIIESDLTDPDTINKVSSRIDYCFHLAAVVGDVDYMSSNPHKIYRNLLIDYNVFEACRINDVKKMLYVSSACVYPTGMQEEDYALLSEDVAFKNGADPDGDYGWTKTIGEQMAISYSERFDIDIPVVRPFNPYGPREKFNPNDSHVIPAFIRRAANKESPFVVWGSGEQVRTFTYVKDLVSWMIKTLENLEGGEPVNLSTDESVTIGELAEIVLDIAGHNCDIRYDTSKPEGVKIRKPDVSKVRDQLNLEEETPLREGIRQTYEWYLENKAQHMHYSSLDIGTNQYSL